MSATLRNGFTVRRYSFSRLAGALSYELPRKVHRCNSSWQNLSNDLALLIQYLALHPCSRPKTKHNLLFSSVKTGVISAR